jgi:hypothetical protein
VKANWRTLVAVVSVLAFSAVATASANANPVFSTEHPFPVKFAMKTGEGAKMEVSKGEQVLCLETSGSGQIAASNEVSNVVYKFSGCKYGAYACPETFESAPLKGRLNYLNKASKEVGLILEGEKAGTGEPVFAELACSLGGFKFTVVITGHIIAPVTPVNLLIEEMHLAYSQSQGEQSPSKFQGGIENQQLFWSANKGTPVKFGISMPVIFKLAAGSGKMTIVA